jgi:hypothetical protein
MFLKFIVMNVIEVLGGNFSTKGNFSAYDDDSNRYFVHKRLMESKKWVKDADVTFPFYAKVAVKQINQLDADGEVVNDSTGKPVVIDRLQITSIFPTKQELIDSCVNKASLGIEIQSAISAKAKESNLTSAQLDLLLSASI